MAQKTDVIEAMKELSMALDKYHPNTETARYVKETMGELQKSEAVDFIGGFSYFLTKSSMLRTSERIELNDTERKLWRKVASYKEVGYKLFPGIGM
jgi:hypothetical protein